MSEPMSGGRRRVDRVLGEGFLDGLAEMTLTEVRQRRFDAEQEEADLYYIRRLLQGRMDIIRAEQQRRATASGDADPLVDQLPQVLGGEGRPAPHGLGRYLNVEHLRQLVHHRVGVATGRAAALLLGPDDVHAALQQPADVGEVGVLLLGVEAPLPHLLQRHLGQPVEEPVSEHPVDPAASAWHRLTHRTSFPPRSLTLSIERAAAGVSGGRSASRARSAARSTSWALSRTGSCGA
jgi:hypothetical protein